MKGPDGALVCIDVIRCYLLLQMTRRNNKSSIPESVGTSCQDANQRSFEASLDFEKRSQTRLGCGLWDPKQTPN